MVGYEKIELSQVGEIITGKTPVTADRDNYGNDFMFIGPVDLRKHFIISHSEKMISRKGIDSIKGSVIDGLSILVGCIGWDMGNVALVQSKCATNQQINSITNIKKDYNPFYIYYWLKNKKDYLFQQANVTRTPILNKTDFSRILIDLPNKNHQDIVAKVLTTIDLKIGLNHKINSELEALAKLIYDYWFVQFDFPDENGKPYKSSGGKMVWSEELQRKIPESWEVKNLLHIATFTNGLACQKFRPTKDEERLRVIKIREMSDGFNSNSEFVRASIPEKLIVKNGDVLFSWSATLDVKIWAGGVGALNQHIFKVTSEKYPKTFYYFELLNYLTHFKMIAELRKTTMGHITQDHLKQSKITIPPRAIIDKIHEVLDPMLEKISRKKEENLELASLRDWLLPMLMNGQVTIGETKDTNSCEDNIIENYDQRKSLAFYILVKSAIDLSLGKVKFEKLLHLSEYHIVKGNWGQNYHQHAAGPLDVDFTYPFFEEAEIEGKITFEKHGPLQRIVVNKAVLVNESFGLDQEARAKIDDLIQKFMGSNYEKPEIISTLYAVWNNRIIKNELITDELLKQDFLAWDPGKAKYKDQLDKNLAWMRRNGIVPDGWGKLIE